MTTSRKAEIPDLRWYTAISKDKGLVPRCRFASVHRCPRYYSSLSLLAHAGSTAIDPEQDKRLKERWSRSDLWPTTAEQATTLIGSANGPQHFWRFCPEVSFDRFRVFASDLADYSDDIDRAVAHARLAREHAPPEDPRWAWTFVHPMHYSECPLYSLLQLGDGEVRPKGPIGFVR